VCLPCGLACEEVERLDSLIYFRRSVKRGHAHYRAGSAFDSIYAGRFDRSRRLSCTMTEESRSPASRSRASCLVDGISTEKHTCDAIALEDSELCVIPFQHLEKLCREFETIQRHFHKLMSGEIVREYGLMLLLGNMRAEERLATFLLNLAQRLKVRGYSSPEVHLRMTREEIGSYLGMKLETVSRTFSKFHDEGLINIQQKQVGILDGEGLRRAAGR
jgi:CRP/FNR family transcriptional regulator